MEVITNIDDDEDRDTKIGETVIERVNSHVT